MTLIGHDRLTAGFQPTLPLRGATVRFEFKRAGQILFQPTLPLRGATSPSPRSSQSASFNPRSPCGERHYAVANRFTNDVSTHAPLAGSDCSVHTYRRECEVSTHAPLAGSDAIRLPRCRGERWFQPTLPLRGATDNVHPTHLGAWFQPTLPLRGATLRQTKLADNTKFQPTLPLRGATCRRLWRRGQSCSFNPRSPCGERLMERERR